MLIYCHEPLRANEPSVLMTSHRSDLSRLGGSSQPGGLLTPLLLTGGVITSRIVSKQSRGLSSNAAFSRVNDFICPHVLVMVYFSKMAACRIVGKSKYFSIIMHLILTL